jgi:lipopolysaccharide biosynthesis glycosyltransferase
MYLRIFAAEALQQDYRRILYLDADIFYARGDISRLLDLDIGNHAVAAVRDTKQMQLPNRTPRDFKPFNLSSSKYFNSGFLLIDTAQFVAQNLEKRVIDFALKNHTKLMHHDQTALNCVLHGDWAELSIVWNYQYNHQYALYAGMYDVCFFHFIGRRKPFNNHYSVASRRFTEPYRVFFEEHFPHMVEGMSDGLDSSTHKTFLGFVFLIHLLNYRKVLKNESLWRTDWDVK